MTATVSSRATETRSDSCVVKVRGLEMRYRDGSEALLGVDLDIKEGELFGLIGPDGAGKTTTLNILSGVLEASGGEAMVFGTQPRGARRIVGYVTQNLSLYPDLTVDENIRYDAGLAGVSEKDYRERSARFLRQMGLDTFSDRLASELSGGMAHKLALCCALISEPRLLLLDEPTTGLDPVSRREVWQILVKLAGEGVTVVIATPDLNEAEDCSRVALLYEGTIHDVGTPEELERGLGLRRLEMAFDDLDSVEKALTKVQAKQAEVIVDIDTTGLRLDVLVKDSKEAEQQARDLLAGEDLPVESLQVSQPTLENVFVMKLREQMPEESRTIRHAMKNPKLSRERDNREASSAIDAKDLSKRFKNFQAVDKVSFEVEYGEIYGLLGANGAGKTTTIKMLCGLLKPTSGTVTLAGESGNLRSRKVRRRVGYMSQKFTLYPGLTVRENLDFYVSVYEIPLEHRQELVEWVLDVCDLADLVDMLVGTLPRGWKQRVAFGASIMHEPDVLFLDEPTAGMDPVARRRMWSLIRDFAKNGTAVLVTTHYLDEAEYCNKLGLMVEGEIVVQGSPLEIKGDEKSLDDAFISIVKRSERNGS